MARPRFFYGYIIVAVCFLITLVITGMISSFGIFFKAIIEDTGWSRTATSGAFSLFSIVGGVLGILAGMLNDKLGPRIVMPLLCFTTALGYFLVSRMSTLWQFYLFYGFIAGIGSNIFVPAMSTVARWFSKRRSLMSGIAFSGAGVGMVVLPPVITWVINAYNWRMSLLIMSIVIMVIVVLAAIFLKSDPGKIGQLPYGAETPVNRSKYHESTSISFGKAIRSRVFWFLIISLFCFGFAFVPFQVHLPIHMSDMGISNTSAAMALTVLGIGIIIGQIGLGGIGDKIGSKKAYLIAMFQIIIAICVVLFARQLWVFFIFAILLGLAFGNGTTQESPLVAWLFGMSSHGGILGVCSFCWTFGAAMGPLVFGAIYDAQGSYQYAFWLAGIVAAVAFILALFLKRPVVDEVIR